MGAELRLRLDSAGTGVANSRAAAYCDLGPTRFEIDPDCPADYQRLGAALARRGIVPDAAVYGWLPGPRFDFGQTPGPAVLRAGGPASLLVMLQATARWGYGLRRLVVVTSGAFRVGPADRVNPLARMATGTVRTARCEAVFADVRQIDVGPARPSLGQILTTVNREIDAVEPVVCYRGGQRYVPVAGPTAAPDLGAPSSIRPGGTYLVTGGLGAIGFEVCRYLQEKFDVSLVLAGRSQVTITGPDERARKLRTLSRAGRVRYVCCDAAAEATLEDAVAAVEKQWGVVLDGIVQLAAESVDENWQQLHEHLLTNESLRAFERTVQAKFLSTWSVARLAALRPACELVLFSSVNTYFGAASFGAYAAACSGLEGFAEHVAASGGAVRCLAWSVWENMGLSRTSEAMAAAVERRGYRSLLPAQALVLFDAALRSEARYLMLGVEPIADSTPDVPQGKAAAGQGGAPTTVLEQTFAAIWCEMLGVDRVGLDDNFFGIGGTSMTAIRSAVALTDRIGALITATDLYDYPTIRQLCGHLESTGSLDPQVLASGGPR